MAQKEKLPSIDARTLRTFVIGYRVNSAMRDKSGLFYPGFDKPANEFGLLTETSPEAALAKAQEKDRRIVLTVDHYDAKIHGENLTFLNIPNTLKCILDNPDGNRGSYEQRLVRKDGVALKGGQKQQIGSFTCDRNFLTICYAPYGTPLREKHPFLTWEPEPSPTLPTPSEVLDDEQVPVVDEVVEAPAPAPVVEETPAPVVEDTPVVKEIKRPATTGLNRTTICISDDLDEELGIPPGLRGTLQSASVLPPKDIELLFAESRMLAAKQESLEVKVVAELEGIKAQNEATLANQGTLMTQNEATLANQGTLMTQNEAILANQGTLMTQNEAILANPAEGNPSSAAVDKAVQEALNKRMDGQDKRMDGQDKRMDGQDKRMDGQDVVIGVIQDRFESFENKQVGDRQTPPPTTER